uniref:Uncharacterized protein n=2 Tax=Clytia hemisphaerica TaxID=252671 RepID=A0A7M5XGM1_9CNID
KSSPKVADKPSSKKNFQSMMRDNGITQQEKDKARQKLIDSMKQMHANGRLKELVERSGSPTFNPLIGKSSLGSFGALGENEPFFYEALKYLDDLGVIGFSKTLIPKFSDTNDLNGIVNRRDYVEIHIVLSVFDKLINEKVAETKKKEEEYEAWLKELSPETTQESNESNLRDESLPDKLINEKVAETKRQEEDHQESNELENTIKEVESNLRDESLPEFENNSCFTLLPMSEVLRRIKTSEHEIVRIHIQGHTLFNRHIRDIVNDGQLTDGVMDSYIKFVTKDRDINVLECTLLKKIFESNVGKLAKIIKTNFIESDLSVGFYNRNQNHWILISTRLQDVWV